MTNAETFDQAIEDELAAQKARNDELERRIEELERKAKPAEPEKPFVPEPYQRYDPTAGMSMPLSALRAMVDAVPDDFMRNVVRDNRAPTTPGTIPSSQQVSGPRPAGGGRGWVNATPIGPPPGIYRVDEQMIADDVRQRAELKRKLGEP